MTFILKQRKSETDEQFEARKADFKKRTEHLFSSDCDGHLYDTRVDGWHKLPPLRPNHQLGGGQRKSYKSARNVAALIRCGQFTFPGCYEKSIVLDDGTALCFPCFTDEFLSRSNLNIRKGGKVKMDVGVSVDLIYEGNVPCENCNKNLAVYGDPEEEEEEEAEVQLQE